MDPDGSGGRPGRPGRWWPVLAPPVLTAVLVVVAQGVASEGFTNAPDVSWGFEVGFVVWGTSPALGLVALVLVARRVRWHGRRALLVGGVVLLALTGLMLTLSLDTESSRAALGLLFAPLYGWLVVGTTGVAVLVATLVAARRPAVSR